MIRKPLRTWVVVGAVVTACAVGDTDAHTGMGAGMVPLAKIEGWRDGMTATADSMLEIAWTRDVAAQAWAENVPAELMELSNDAPLEQVGLRDDLSAVDFDTQALVVWSSAESSTCPVWLSSVHTNDDGELEPEISFSGGPDCTEDANPYRMLLAVERASLPDDELLPSDGFRAGWGRLTVTAYPIDAAE